MSKRSLFYPRPLIGQGTEHVQSLLSYLEHLALAHSMKPRALLETLFREFPIPHSTAGIKTSMTRGGIHGNANIGVELRKRLELATGASLQGSTLERYKDIFAAANLTRIGTAYCPCCVQEDDDLPHLRLLWQVQCVTACPVHKVKLRLGKACGAAASDKLPVQKRPSLGGVCTQCGSVGFRCITDAPQEASAEEVWVAEQVARLIGVPEAEVARFSAESLRVGLTALVQSAYQGSVVRAALSAGLSRGSVCTWVQGAVAGLPWLLQLCFHAGADIVELVGGSFHLLPDQWTAGRRYDVVSRPYKFAATEDSDVRELLRQAAAEPNPLSLRDFARKHGLHLDTPRQRFPQEATLLASARGSYLKKIRDGQFADAIEAYTQAAHTLRSNGKTVHIGALQRESGLVAFSQNLARVRALEAVVADFRRAPAEVEGAIA